tara:strand:+ start:497 stop:1393 length:897 start_codon:yes stop_codon:yes gene_type:complete
VADIKDLIKPPFANYDVVVYFGCGLFSLPLINHYVVEPSGFRFPKFEFEIGTSFANQAVSTLSLLFAVYLLGHMIAFASSLLTEKSIESFFGKASSAILISTMAQERDHLELVTAFIFKKSKEGFRKPNKKLAICRFIILLPVIPLYLLIIWVGGFSYYKSRISYFSISRLRRKAVEKGICTVTLNGPWYKEIEHYVMNRYPIAVSRMYNYLVISGIFRSLSIIFLSCIWMEIYYLLHFSLSGHYHINVLASDLVFGYERFASILALFVVYGFSVSSYMKFQRRYAEEAIFAFLMSED